MAQVDFRYRRAGTWGTSGAGTATDPRDAFDTQMADMQNARQVDPMLNASAGDASGPAPRVSPLPAERVNSLSYAYDWLGNQVHWSDDSGDFYERSIGTADTARRDILSGADVNEATGAPNSGTAARPAALYFASNILNASGAADPTIVRGGYVTLEHGESGNVLSMTVRSTCRDVSTSATNLCSETGASTNASARAAYLSANCSCDVEQHYQYRWDAVNRLAEARRYDRGVTRGGNSGSWQLQTRQQYEYDESNNRLLKRVVDGFSGSANGLDGQERMALYVAPGAFERRGLVTGASSYDVEAPRRAETQYLVATPGGTARLIWAETNGAPGNGAFAVFNREARLTMNVTDLLQSTSAVIDLFDGDVLERGTYLPSGVRETRTLDEAQEAFPLEPLGFTGKEDDLEVGLMYFGHRYLMPHLGRWASPDPLQIHAGGGGEFGNSYHYVSGNLLQARDPDGLDDFLAYNAAAVRYEMIGIPTHMVYAVWQQRWNAIRTLNPFAYSVEIIPDGDTNNVRTSLNIISLERSVLFEFSLDAADAYWHETLHAFLDINEDDPEVADLMRRGTEHFRGDVDRNTGESLEAERSFEEAAGNYVGGRVAAIVGARRLLRRAREMRGVEGASIDGLLDEANRMFTRSLAPTTGDNGGSTAGTIQLSQELIEDIEQLAFHDELPNEFSDLAGEFGFSEEDVAAAIQESPSGEPN